MLLRVRALAFKKLMFVKVYSLVVSPILPNHTVEIGSVFPASSYHGNRPSKPYTKTEVAAGLKLNDATCNVVVVTGSKYLEYINQDQKYNNKNTQTITETMNNYEQHRM